MDEVPVIDRADYWQVRALSEQARREQMEGELAQLRALVESGRTRARLEALFATLKADGIIDLAEGEWRPDDSHEQFVRIEPSQDASAKP